MIRTAPGTSFRGLYPTPQALAAIANDPLNMAQQALIPEETKGISGGIDAPFLRTAFISESHGIIEEGPGCALGRQAYFLSLCKLLRPE